MLPRTFTRALRQHISDNARSSCAVCACSCGRLFRSNGLPIQQKRFREPRPNQMSHAQRVKLQQEEKARRDKERDNVDLEEYRKEVTRLVRDELLYSTVDNAMAFLQGFDQLDRERRGTREDSRVKEEPMHWLARSTTMNGRDVAMLAWSLNLEDRDRYRQLGERMMYSLARVGNAMGVTEIMRLALLEAKTRPRALMSTALAPVRKRLALLAQGTPESRPDELFLTRTIEGRVQYALGNHDRAIELWTECIESLPANDFYSTQTSHAHISYFFDFAYPWVELTNACLLKGDRGRAKWAINMGCLNGDPKSHYDAALFELSESKYGKYAATSSWLYHMTRAAGGGNVKAAHVLGCWYASSNWKYLANEPPGHIKPTPFDAYPPDAASKTPTSSLWHRLGVNLGFYSQQAGHEDDAKDSIFRLAAFPSAAADRARIAMQWLQVGMSRNYAPSYLAAARLRLKETLHAKAAAPAKALELSDERYAYASRADYEAGIKIPRESEDGADEDDEIPNPLYDPAAALELLCNVFFAKQALKARQEAVAKARSKGRMGPSVMDSLEVSVFVEFGLPENIRKWFRFPEVRETFMDDATGKLWDWEAGVDLEVEARKICDEWGWDVRDEEGGLIYRHKGKRG